MCFSFDLIMIISFFSLELYNNECHQTNEKFIINVVVAVGVTQP